MKIVIALDSFKGSMTAPEACRFVCDAINTYNAKLVDREKPMADGGKGTAGALLAAKHGQQIPQTVMGPLPHMPVQTGFGWLAEHQCAVVEMATANGIGLLAEEELNPLLTTTFGSGQLIEAAADKGAQTILLAVGGSATMDCSVRAAMTLGQTFRDKQDNDIRLGGGELKNISPINIASDLNLSEIEVSCDVDNPLCGEKGATPEMIEIMENEFLNIAELIRKELGKDVLQLRRAGTAGGLAAGAAAFMHAKLVSGVDTVMKEIKLARELAEAAWVITGEGRLDHQSLDGKVVSGVVKIAKQHNTRVAVLPGSVALSSQECKEHGIEIVIPCKGDHMKLEYAMKHGAQLLHSATGELCKYIIPF